MGLTHFPHGILAMPSIGGSGRFAGWWTGRVLFVDGTGGSDSNGGIDIGNAKKTLQAAVTLAGANDTIYVKPQAVGVRYTENIIVPVGTKAGLNIIGTGNGRGNSVYQACSFKGVTGVDAPVLILNSSYANIENIAFWSVAAQTIAGFGVLLRWNTPVGLALNIGSSIVNCSFTADVDDNPAAAGATQNAIRMDSTEGQLVEGCMFHNCRTALSVGSTQSAASAIKFLSNLLTGLAANIAADIYATDVNGLEIDDNIFGHAVPSHAAGTLLKYIYVAGTVTGNLAKNYQGASAVAAGTNNTLSNLIAAGNFGLGGPWTS